MTDGSDGQRTGDGAATASDADVPRFIWGRAYAALDTLDERTFLTHTQSPRFICTVSEIEEDELPEPLASAGKDELAIVEVLGPTAGASLWLTSSGLLFQGFDFVDALPETPTLSQVLLFAAADFDRFIRSADPRDEDEGALPGESPGTGVTRH